MGVGLTELPSGTVTFLFTDLEGSTRLWEEQPEGMRDALARHDEILSESVASEWWSHRQDDGRWCARGVRDRRTTHWMPRSPRSVGSLSMSGTRLAR